MKTSKQFILLLLLLSILNISAFSAIQEYSEIKTEKTVTNDNINVDTIDQLFVEHTFILFTFTSHLHLLTFSSFLYTFHLNQTLLRPPIL